jgi:hypothetical protein
MRTPSPTLKQYHERCEMYLRHPQCQLVNLLSIAMMPRFR